jgi:hypothetical protein
LGCFIALLVNASWGSIIVVDSVPYLAGHSFILGIHDMVYYINFGVWNFVAYSAMAILLLLHYFFHSIELQLYLIVFVDVGSPCNHVCCHFTILFLEFFWPQTEILTTIILFRYKS